MRKLEEITIFDFTDIGGQRATSYDIIEKYMREFFADDPRTQADVMKALKARPTKTLTRGLHRRPLLFAQYLKMIRKYQNPISAHILHALNTFHPSAHLRFSPFYANRPTFNPQAPPPHPPLQSHCSVPNRPPPPSSAIHPPFPGADGPPFSVLPTKKPPAFAEGPNQPFPASKPCSSRPGSTRPLYHITPQNLAKILPKIPTHSNPFQPIPTHSNNPPKSPKPLQFPPPPPFSRPPPASPLNHRLKTEKFLLSTSF